MARTVNFADGPPLTREVTGEEYVEILLRRQADYMAEHGIESPYLPLLEWFIRDGDEQFVRLPQPEPEPEPQPKQAPRAYRSAASIRAELAELEARMATVAGRSDYGDRAAANLSPHARSRAARTAGRRRFAQMDRDLATYARLSRKRDQLAGRLRSAEARETTQANAASDASDASDASEGSEGSDTGLPGKR